MTPILTLPSKTASKKWQFAVAAAYLLLLLFGAGLLFQLQKNSYPSLSLRGSFSHSRRATLLSYEGRVELRVTHPEQSSSPSDSHLSPTANPLLKWKRVENSNLPLFQGQKMRTGSQGFARIQIREGIVHLLPLSEVSFQQTLEGIPAIILNSGKVELTLLNPIHLIVQRTEYRLEPISQKAKVTFDFRPSSLTHSLRVSTGIDSRVHFEQVHPIQKTLAYLKPNEAFALSRAEMQNRKAASEPDSQSINYQRIKEEYRNLTSKTRYIGDIQPNAPMTQNRSDEIKLTFSWNPVENTKEYHLFLFYGADAKNPFRHLKSASAQVIFKTTPSQQTLSYQIFAVKSDDDVLASKPAPVQIGE